MAGGLEQLGWLPVDIVADTHLGWELDIDCLAETNREPSFVAAPSAEQKFVEADRTEDTAVGRVVVDRIAAESQFRFEDKPKWPCPQGTARVVRCCQPHWTEPPSEIGFGSFGLCIPDSDRELPGRHLEWGAV